MKAEIKNELYNIVVIDDEENNLKSVELALAGQPYNLILFTNPVAAMKDINVLKNASIILLDVMMPEISGFEIAEKLKNNSSIAAPIILLTSLSDIQTKRHAYSLGVDDYIIKPIIEEELISKIEKKIDISKRIKESEKSWKMMKSILEDIIPHEIRTPLASLMIGFSDSENQTFKFETELKNLFAFMEKNVPEINTINFYCYLKDRLMDIIKHEGEIKSILNHSIARLENLVKKIVYYNQSLEIIKKNVKLKNLIIDLIREYDKEIEFDLEDINAFVDEKLIMESLKVLVDNCYLHNQDDVQVKIQLDGKTTGYSRIQITDNGVGIKAGYLQDLFKPYHIAHEVLNHREGIGLGLYFVKKVVEAHDGEIKVESKPNVETQFTITIPNSTI